MDKRRISQILIILLLLIPAVNFIFFLDNFTNKSYKEIMKPNISTSWDLTGTRIIIDNNWSSTALAYDWCSGNGTIDNPYIIENITIDGGNEFALTITNSRVYFIVRNSKFVNIPTGNLSYYSNNGGITLSNVSNGQLINNNISFNGVGIYVLGYNNTISKNYISYNNVGIWIFTSQQNSTGTFTTISENNITHNSIGIIGSSGGHGAQITSNNVSYNENSGIFLRSTYNFSITNNVINNNTGKGIYLIMSFYNNISKNEINNNGDEGIGLEGWFSLGLPPSPFSTYNWISENIVNNNSDGIKLNATDRNQIINNFLNYNRNTGISLHISDLNTILNNNVNNSDIGINLENSISNDVVANIIDNSELVGIRLHYTDFTTISNNTVNNNYIGINLTNSKRNDMIDNVINYNHYGIYFTDSRLNTIIENNLMHNVKCYVEEGNSVENTFEDNVCPEGGGLNIGLIISIVLLLISIPSLVIMFWLNKKRVLKK